MSKVKNVLMKNSPLILTSVAATGVAATAILTAQASFKAAEILRAEEEEAKEELTNEERFKLVWSLYLPAAGVGISTIASIILLNRVGYRRAAAATALYTVTDKAFKEYKDKVVEKIGEKKETELRDEVAQDAVEKNPPKDREVIITGSGNVLCYDSLTGRYFNSDIETIRKAENDINQKVLYEMYASLTDFYELIGLEPTALSEEMGWNVDDLLSLSFSTTLTEDKRPCISVDYRVAPIRGYDRMV